MFLRSIVRLVNGIRCNFTHDSRRYRHLGSILARPRLSTLEAPNVHSAGNKRASMAPKRAAHAPCMVAIDRANGSCQRRRSAPHQHPRRCLRQEEIADAKRCLADRCARRHASLGRYSSEAIVAEGVMATSAQPKPTMTCRRIGGRSLLGARHSRAFSQQIMWGNDSKWREFSIFGVVKRPHDRRKGGIALTHHLDDCPSVGYTLQRAIRPSKQQTSWTNTRATSVPTHTIRTLPLPYRDPTPP